MKKKMIIVSDDLTCFFFGALFLSGPALLLFIALRHVYESLMGLLQGV